MCVILTLLGGCAYRTDAIVGQSLADTCTRDSDCELGSFCDSEHSCTPHGRCRSDADCPTSGERCGAGSGWCQTPGACQAHADCPVGKQCSAERLCENSECGRSELVITSFAPNIVFLLDRGSSMDHAFGTQTRWDSAVDAIGRLTRRYDGQIRFGLAIYPACTDCNWGALQFAIGESNGAAISDYLESRSDRFLCDRSDAQAPLGAALDALSGDLSNAVEPALTDSTRNNAIIILTDGDGDTCSDVSAELAAESLAEQPSPVRIFVVELGDRSRDDELQRVANAGNGALFDVDSVVELEGAIESVAIQVASCNYQLLEAPPDPALLHVYFDDTETEISPREWVYDEISHTIRFSGNACDSIVANQVSDIDVVFGCPEPFLE